MFEQHRVHGIERDSPEFREMIDHRTWCPTNHRARRVRTTGRSDACRWVFAFSVKVRREDCGFQARVSIPLVRREERGDVVQCFSGTRGRWDDRVFDFSRLFENFRERERWLGVATHGISKYVVNRYGVTAEDESCHVDYAFPFTCECQV